MEIHRGITRTVFVTRRWAIKVPSLRSYKRNVRGSLWSITRGIQANLSEADWSDSPGVCPVRWSLLGLINVYPRCELLPPDADVDYDAIGALFPSDKKPENVGKLDGRLVWIDYDMSWNDCPHTAGQPPN